MLGRVRVFSSGKKGRKQTRKRERVVDKKQEVEPTSRMCHRLAGVAAVAAVAAVAGWPGEGSGYFRFQEGV